MPRTITEEVKERVYALAEEFPDRLGVVLGALVFRGEIPVDSVAKLLNVTPASAYRWLHGSVEPREIYKVNIRKLINILRRAHRAFDLPLKGTPKERADRLVEVIIKHKKKPG